MTEKRKDCVPDVIMDHLLDVYKELGVRWGDDPFTVIAHLKESDEMWTEAHNESVTLSKEAEDYKALILRLQLERDAIVARAAMAERMEKALRWFISEIRLAHKKGYTITEQILERCMDNGEDVLKDWDSLQGEKEKSDGR